MNLDRSLSGCNPLDELVLGEEGAGRIDQAINKGNLSGLRTINDR